MGFTLSSFTVPQLIHISTMLFLWLIVTPILIYWTVRITYKKTTIIMQKRYIGLSILSCWLCIIWIFLGVPTFIYYSFFEIISANTIPIGVALSILYPVLGHGIMYTLSVRFFMLYFHHNWTDITLSSHWIIHIRKPSSKDKEREEQLLKEHSNSANNNKKKKKRNKTKHAPIQVHINNQPSKPKPNADTLHVDTNTNGYKKENSGQHLQHPNHQNPLMIDENNQDDKTIQIHTQIQFTSRVIGKWFIKNRPKYGSVKKILTKLYFIYVIAICIVIFVSVMAAYSQKQVSFWPICHTVVRYVLFLVPCSATFYFWYKTPAHIQDIFCFRDEMRHLLIVNIIICILWFLYTIANISQQFSVYLKIIHSVSVIFLCSSTVYYQTEWLLQRINKQKAQYQCEFYNKPFEYFANPHLYRETYSKTSNTTVSTLSPVFNLNPAVEMPQIQENQVQNNFSKESTEKLDNNYGYDIKAPESIETDDYNKPMYKLLFRALQSDKLFNDFTRHLASELSMECSFAFIEFTQYQYLMERDLTFMQSVRVPSSDSPITITAAYSYQNVKLPRTISRSSIVHNKKYARMLPKHRYKKIAKKLSEKYLEACAEFELPISRERKKEVINWVSLHCRHLKAPRGRDYSNPSSKGSSYYSSQSEQSTTTKGSSKTSIADQLYHLFEDCRKDIYFLMAHSCDRFVKTEAYQRSINNNNTNIIINNNNNNI